MLPPSLTKLWVEPRRSVAIGAPSGGVEVGPQVVSEKVQSGCNFKRNCGEETVLPILYQNTFDSTHEAAHSTKEGKKKEEKLDKQKHSCTEHYTLTRWVRFNEI